MLPWTVYAFQGTSTTGLVRTFPMVRFDANADLTAIANLLKAQPPGARVLLPWSGSNLTTSGLLNYLHDATNITATGNQQGVWPNASMLTTLYAGTTGVFQQLKNLGATIDAISLDFEDGFNIFQINYPANAARLPAIQSDARSAAIASALGFADFTTEIALDATTPQTHLTQKTAWDNYMRTQVQAGLRTGIFTPAQAAFPSVSMSNFGSAKIAQADQQYDGNGYPGYQTDDLVGNTASVVAYGGVGAIGFLPTVGGVAPRPNDPWWVLIWTNNLLRAQLRSIGSAQSAPWVQAKSITANSQFAFPLGGTLYYDELIRHAFLGSSGFLWYFNAGNNDIGFAPASDDLLIDAIAQELFTVSNGLTPAEWLTTAEIPYATSDFFYSYVTLNDRSTLGRVSFNVGTNSATFTTPTDGKTYTVSRVSGQNGAWFGTNVPIGGGGAAVASGPKVLSYRLQGTNPPEFLRIKVS